MYDADISHVRHADVRDLIFEDDLRKSCNRVGGKCFKSVKIVIKSSVIGVDPALAHSGDGELTHKHVKGGWNKRQLVPVAGNIGEERHLYAVFKVDAFLKVNGQDLVGSLHEARCGKRPDALLKYADFPDIIPAALKKDPVRTRAALFGNHDNVAERFKYLGHGELTVKLFKHIDKEPSALLAPRCGVRKGLCTLPLYRFVFECHIDGFYIKKSEFSDDFGSSGDDQSRLRYDGYRKDRGLRALPEHFVGVLGKYRLTFVRKDAEHHNKGIVRLFIYASQAFRDAAGILSPDDALKEQDASVDPRRCTSPLFLFEYAPQKCVGLKSLAGNGKRVDAE